MMSNYYHNNNIHDDDDDDDGISWFDVIGIQVTTTTIL